MSKLIDLTGEKFNNLLVIARAENSPKGASRWKCLCDCGKETIVMGYNLKSGGVKSCGCLSSRNLKLNKTHGDSRTKLYNHWLSMIYRCSNPKNTAFKWYGGRGIKVCPEWQSYENFKKWALSTRPDEKYTVERIDVNGDYCPQNCKWIPMSEQANNRTTCIMITHNGETKNLMQWCKEYGMDYRLVHNRMYKYKWEFEKAITTPLNQKNSHKKRK